VTVPAGSSRQVNGVIVMLVLASRSTCRWIGSGRDAAGDHLQRGWSGMGEDAGGYA